MHSSFFFFLESTRSSFILESSKVSFNQKIVIGKMKDANKGSTGHREDQEVIGTGDQDSGKDTAHHIAEACPVKEDMGSGAAATNNNDNTMGGGDNGPTEWRAVTDKMGKVYYYNKRTKRIVREVSVDDLSLLSLPASPNAELSMALRKNQQLSAEVQLLKIEREALSKRLALYQARLQNARECRMIPALLSTLRTKSDELAKALLDAKYNDASTLEQKLAACTTADEVCVVLEEAMRGVAPENTAVIGALNGFRFHVRSTTECDALRQKCDNIRGHANHTIEALTVTLRQALMRLSECGVSTDTFMETIRGD